MRRSINKAESTYYNELFNSKMNSINNMWKSLGHIINPNKKHKRNEIHKILDNGQFVTDNRNIANVMNNHFCSVGCRLQQQLPRSNGREYLKYLPPPTVNSFLCNQ